MWLSQNTLSVIFILKISNSHMCNILCNFLFLQLYIVINVHLYNIIRCLMCNLLWVDFLYLFNKFEYVLPWR